MPEIDTLAGAFMSPRGGPPGFVTVLDDRHPGIPDAHANRLA